MRLGRLRLDRYVRTLGRVPGSSLFLREVFGDRRRVTVRHRGRRLALRLTTSDILVLYSVLEREDYGIELATAPATIVDAGAYVGYSAIYFAERYPAATVFALEPDPSNFALLLLNTRPHPNIVPLNLALWHREGRLALHDSAAGDWGLSVIAGDSPAAVPRAEVEAITIPGILQRFSLQRIDLLKIDVEGAEKGIFEHAGDWIGRVGAVFAELHDLLNPGCGAAFERATASFGRVFRDGMTVCAIRDDVEPPAKRSPTATNSC